MVRFSKDVEKQFQYLFSEPEERKALLELASDDSNWIFIPNVWEAIQNTVNTARRAVFYNYNAIIYRTKLR